MRVRWDLLLSYFVTGDLSCQTHVPRCDLDFVIRYHGASAKHATGK